LRKNVAFVEPMTKAAGVRFCFMLIDSDFELEDVNEINDFLSEEIGKLK
jgi:hypothetical protein